MQLFGLTEVANFATVRAVMTEQSPLKSYRVASQKTLDALASELGVNKSTILRWETDAVLIPVSRLANVERVTGIPRSVLRPDIFSAPEAAE